MGLWYEDFDSAQEHVTGERTVSQADFRAFGELSGDDNPIHFDPAAARAAGLAGPLAHGALGLALATGLVGRLGLTRGTLVALLEVRWRFAAPVTAGDVLHAVVRVAGRRETSRADRGIVTLAVRLLNGRGELVQEGELIELVRRRP